LHIAKAAGHLALVARTSPYWIGMRAPIGLHPALRNLVLGAALIVSSLPVRADEISGSAVTAGFVIHSADETLKQFCKWDGDKLWFQAPDGSRWELVTTTTDAIIANPGDGAFHPYDPAEVKRALDGVRYPLARVSAEIFLLPFPRRLGLDSAAGPGLILLSPGVRALSVQQQHAEFTHELGHVVQYALMPDADTLQWADYRGKRGITDETIYAPTSIHCNRPHEIFAEDFRALFGDSWATTTGTIENVALAYPTGVLGLSAWMSTLEGIPSDASRIGFSSAAPAGVVTLSRDSGGAAVLDVFDVGGRRIASVTPVARGEGCLWSWDGRDAAGARVRGAILFARARDGVGGVAKVALAR
jgi:hypothetical protein